MIELIREDEADNIALYAFYFSYIFTQSTFRG